MIDRTEEFEERVGLPSAALGSGTAAIHLGLRLPGVGSGDEVFCPTRRLGLEDQLYVVNHVRAAAGVAPLPELQQELVTVI